MAVVTQYAHTRTVAGADNKRNLCACNARGGICLFYSMSHRTFGKLNGFAIHIHIHEPRNIRHQPKPSQAARHQRRPQCRGRWVFVLFCGRCLADRPVLPSRCAAGTSFPPPRCVCVGCYCYCYYLLAACCLPGFRLIQMHDGSVRAGLLCI